MFEPKVTIGLYRHFKGQYYYVSSITKSAVDEKTHLVNYFNICHPSYGTFTRPVDDFIATVDDRGICIVDRKDNVTGMPTRFERVEDLNFQIRSVSTEQLIYELQRRADSPIHELDIEGLRSPVFCKDFVVGDKYFETEDYPCGVSTIASFETEQEAKKYFSTHKHRLATSVFKRTFIEVL